MKGKINTLYIVLIALIVALGGFLLGFDSAVISGAVPYYSQLFGLEQTSFWFGFSVSALTVGSIAGNFIGGILADKYGRKIVLISTAILFAYCALGSALTSSLVVFIISRLIGGLGVGMAILVAPMYIAEVAPQKYRGTLVSINQLNIVLGISIAFFSNLYINKNVTDPDLVWRWMLGVGALPALLYFVLLFFVPASPRWLAKQGRFEEAKNVLKRIGGEEYALSTLNEIETNIEKEKTRKKSYFNELLNRDLRWILIIGLGIAALQQLSAINAILYYAPIIFETAGGGRDAAFMQAVIIGLVNLVFTIVAMFLIDKLGRKPLLIIGLSGIILAYVISAFAFFNAEYKITAESLDKISVELSKDAKITPEKSISIIQALSTMKDVQYTSEIKFFNDVKAKTGDFYNETKNVVLKNSINMNAILVLMGILIFIASFAISLGPVTWALLSEVFPNHIRGLAISVAGTFNALVSATVVTVFPAELAKFGSGATFAIFAAICFVGLLFVLKYIPETKGKSLEEIEVTLMRH